MCVCIYIYYTCTSGLQREHRLVRSLGKSIHPRNIRCEGFSLGTSSINAGIFRPTTGWWQSDLVLARAIADICTSCPPCAVSSVLKVLGPLLPTFNGVSKPLKPQNLRKSHCLHLVPVTKMLVGIIPFSRLPMKHCLKPPTR